MLRNREPDVHVVHSQNVLLSLFLIYSLGVHLSISFRAQPFEEED